MKTKLLLAACCLTVLIGGCNIVVTENSFGDPATEADLDKLQGVWINEDTETAHVRVAQNGDLMLGALTWSDDKNQFIAENLTLKATSVGETKLLFVYKSEEQEKKGAFFFVRYEFVDEGKLNIHNAIPARFAEAVENGDLEGTVDRKEKEKTVSVGLTGTSEVIRDYLLKADIDEFFEPESSFQMTILKPKEKEQDAE